MAQSTSAIRRFGNALLRRPAIALLILLAGGIFCRDHLPVHPWVWIITAAGLSVAAVVQIHRSILSNSCLAICVFLLGLSSAQIERFSYPKNNIWNYTDTGEHLAQIELKLDESPRLLGQPPGQLRALPPKQIALAQVRAVQCTTGWESATGQVALSIEQLNPRLASGQIIRITGMLERPLPLTSPGEFDWAAYYRRQHILATVRVNHADSVQIIQDNGPSAISWLRDKSRHLLAMGFPADRGFDHSLLWALLLGDSDPQLREIQDEFTRTGTIHYLSVSGLHIAIIGAFVLMLFRLLRMSPRASLVAAMAFVILYATVALPTWPGVRSTVMCLAAAAGLLGRRPVDSVNLLALSVAGVLFYQPGDLSDGGFQVSFAAVLGMILFSNRASKWFWDLWKPVDPKFGIRRRSALGSASLWLGRFVIGTLAAGCIAWLASMPLVAYHFGQISPLSAPAGIVLLPVTVLAMLGGAMKILLTLCWPSAAGFWATTCTAPIVWMHHIVQHIDQLPGSSFRTGAPSVLNVIVYYSIFALAFVPWKRVLTKWLGRLAIPVACAIFIFAPTTPSLAGAASSHHHIQITLLSIGAGQTAVVQTDSNHAILIDAGSSTVADVTRSVLTPYLRQVGCRNIDRIFLSHGDFDHISAAADIFLNYSEPDILMSPHFARHAVGNIPAEALLKTMEDANRAPHIIHQGDHLELGNGASIDVLWPPVDCTYNSNDCGLVLKLHYAGKSVLFPADIEVLPEAAMLLHPELLKSDVLVAPHHGSAEKTTGAFIQAIAPQFILASNATKLTHKQKTFDEVAKDYPVYRTSRCGTITVTIEDDGKISVETFNGAGPVQAIKVQ